MALEDKTHTLQEPIRVGLLLNSFTQPRWVSRIIGEIQQSSFAVVALIVLNEGADFAPPDRGTGEKLRSVWRSRKHALYTLYTRFDESRARLSPDAFAPVDIEPLLEGCTVLRVKPSMTKHSDYFRDEDVEEILAHRLDVALRFGFRILRGRSLDIARNGVWSYHHGDNLVNRGGPPGFWEVMRGEAVSGSVLQALTEDLDAGRVLYRSWAPTLSRSSVRRNKNNYYWKSSAFVMRKLRELHESGEVSSHDGADARAFRPYSARLFETPTNTEMLPLLARLGGGFVTGKLSRLAYEEDWGLAYHLAPAAAGTDAPASTLYRFKHLNPPRGRFWADPFPVEADGEYYIFFEEYLHEQAKGVISYLRLDAKGDVREGPTRVLEREYHLSYPFVFDWQGDRYMIPDTSARGTVELYKCVSFPRQWELQCVLLEGVQGADATLHEQDGVWWMFVNIADEGVSQNWDELHLFHAESPQGPWRPHPSNPVKSDVRSARPAGRLFSYEGELYRPAQDCSKRYGWAITINCVERLDELIFQERQVSKILPDWRASVIATHTINHAGRLTVVDCLVRRRRAF
jgi:hypothetical protein